MPGGRECDEAQKRIGRTMRSIAASYCVVLLLPLVFGVLLHGLAIRLVSTEIEQSQRQVLEHAEESVSAGLRSLNNIMDIQLLNQDISHLAKLRDFHQQDYWRMKAVQEKLRFACSSNSYIDEMLLFFHNSDAVLGSNGWFSHVSEAEGVLNILGMSVSEFQQQLAQTNDFRFFIAQSGRQMPYVIRSNASSTVSGMPTFTILARMTKDSLNRLISAQDAETFLFDENGHYLCTAGAAAIGDTNEILNAARSGASDFASCRLIDVPSSLLSIRYVRLIPTSIYARDAFSMVQLLLGYVAICLLLGGPLTAYMVRRSYNPIKQIVSILPTVSSPQEMDDFTRIEHSLTELMRRNSQNENKIDRNADRVRAYLLGKLLREGKNFESEFISGCQEFGLHFPYHAWLIAAMDVEDGSSLFFENCESVNKEMSQLAFFATRNLLREQLDFPLFVAEHDGLLVALINIDETLDTEAVLGGIRHFGRNLDERMLSDYRVSISLSVSGVHEGFDGVQLCWQEISRIVLQRDIEKKPSLLMYRDLEINEEQANLEKQAIRAIRGHAYAVARDLLKQAINLPGEEEVELETENAPSPKEAGSIPAILQFMDANFADPNLSIAAIAEQFHLSPSYFSLYFKRKMNISPLEYINLKRIDKVKELLATDLPIKTIARNVGYFDTRPMIRFFKRSEGLTPAEYREQLQM